MAFGDVRKCPVCPGYWIEDNQMYLDPEICPQCGADAGDYIGLRAHGAGPSKYVLGLDDGDDFALDDDDLLELE